MSTSAISSGAVCTICTNVATPMLNHYFTFTSDWLYYGRNTEDNSADDVDETPEIEARRLEETVPISEHHKSVILDTWPLVAEQMAENGTRVFFRIFELSPRIKNVFGFGPDQSGRDIVNHPRLVGHASRFMEALESAVSNLDALDEIVAPVFINLGKHHVNFQNIDGEFFGVFSGAMMFAWREAMGSKFTAEVRSAWSRLFDFVLQHLRFGYHLEMEDRRNK